MMLRCAAALASAVLSAPMAAGQDRLFAHPGADGGAQLGRSAAGAGDVDNDGHADVVAGAPFRSVRAASAGGLSVWSGRSGKILFRIEGDAAGDRLGCAVAGIGDADGDGHADFAAGAPHDDDGGTDSGSVRAFSGKTGAVLFTTHGQQAFGELGASLAGCGDASGDGVPDLVAGAPFTDFAGVDSGSVYLISGKGGILRRFDGARARDLFGWAVGGGGDVDRDGRPDVVASALQPFGGGGQVLVLSGRTAATLWTLRGTPGQSEFGFGLADAGDVDNDGHADVVLGASGFHGNLLNHGEVLVFSGRTGLRLHAFPGERLFHYFGRAVAGLGDLNGDGHADVAGGTGPGGYAKAFCGKTGRLLFRLGGTTADEFGAAVAGPGDVNADGTPDLVVGAWRTSGPVPGAGAASVYSGRTLSLRTDRHAIRLGTGGAQGLSIDAGASAARGAYLLLGSASGTRPGFAIGAVRVPLNIDAYLAFTFANANVPPLQNTFGALDASGRALARFVLPPASDPSLDGLVLEHAALIAGGSLSIRAATNASPLLLTR